MTMLIECRFSFYFIKSIHIFGDICYFSKVNITYEKERMCRFLSYVTPARDVHYSDINIFTAHKIYEIVKENQDTMVLINDLGEIDELHKSLIHGRYPTHRMAVIHNNLFLWICFRCFERIRQPFMQRKRNVKGA
ncbi:hypothetical protein D3C85_1326870 [compost metagenome]